MANSKRNGGPTRSPSKKLTKRLAYTEALKLNNATTSYSYYSAYIKPDVTKCLGAAAQFAAYELWRLKKIKVSIQMASTPGATAGALDRTPTATVWTAADFGANESISGETIMQYQNAKKNTCSLNDFTVIVDTSARINLPGNTNFILPPSSWVNTALFNSSGYSGYQIFLQNFGLQTVAVEDQPSYTLVTELDIEFMQPAFQNNASSFTVDAFDIKMITIPDASSPDTRTYVFDNYRVWTNSGGTREFLIHLIREDGVSGSLTFTGEELRNAIRTGTSTPYFNGRRIIYDGPTPPTEIPSQDYEIQNNV